MTSRTGKKWTNREIDFVMNNYGAITAKNIAKALRRTESGVRWKATELGLTGLDRVIKQTGFKADADLDQSATFIYPIDKPIIPRRNWFQRLFRR